MKYKAAIICMSGMDSQVGMSGMDGLMVTSQKQGKSSQPFLCSM